MLHARGEKVWASDEAQRVVDDDNDDDDDDDEEEDSHDDAEDDEEESEEIDINDKTVIIESMVPSSQ